LWAALQDVNVLLIPSVYIIFVCYIEINKDNLEQNIEICSYNFCKFWSLMFNVMTCFRKSVMSMGIKLYNQLPKHIVEKHGPCDFVHVHSTADSSFKINLRKVTKSVGIFRTPVSVILHVYLPF